MGEENRHDTAARHLVAGVPVALPVETVAGLLGRLQGGDFDAADTVYVVDGGRRLLGVIPLTKLLATAGDTPLGRVMTADPPRVHPEEDQETVAGLALERSLASVPVVDRNGRFLGAVPPEALIQILRREHIEDLDRFTGIIEQHAHAKNALEDRPFRRVKDRLPWLLVGLVGSMAATWIVSRFEAELEKRVVIAFFVPGIVYLADAIGTQTEAIAVRGLSFSDYSLRRLLLGELKAGFLIGLLLGLLAFPAVFAVFGEVRLALSVAISLCLAGGIATSIGLFLPWLLSSMGKDPAFGSGPVATIFQDILSVLIYFCTVSFLLF